MSTARCPNKCKTIKNNDEFFCDGHTENYGDCGFGPGQGVCLDTKSSNNIYIGNLGLEITGIAPRAVGIKYKYDDDARFGWYVYYAQKIGLTRPKFGPAHEVTDQDKLNTLNKLNSAPFHIRSIGLFKLDNSADPARSVIRNIEFVAKNTDQLYDYKIGVDSTGPAKHLFFSDSAKDIYCLGIPRASVWGLTEFPHVVDYSSHNNKLQYIGYAVPVEAGGEILTYC